MQHGVGHLSFRAGGIWLATRSQETASTPLANRSPLAGQICVSCQKGGPRWVDLCLAGEQGFEPRFYGPEPYVLPLDDSPVLDACYSMLDARYNCLSIQDQASFSYSFILGFSNDPCRFHQARDDSFFTEYRHHFKQARTHTEASKRQARGMNQFGSAYT